MSEKITNYLTKHKIDAKDIKYITREEHKTCLHLTDGRIERTFITAREFYEHLAPFGYVSVNKGTILAKDQIAHIDHFTYYMKDGASFNGRRRTIGAHRRLNTTLTEASSNAVSPSSIAERFSVLDDMPAAFCVIELVFNEEGSGVDFIFRYCNKEMEVLEGKTIAEMMNHSFYKVFPDADKKWLVFYADVALTGNPRSWQSYSPEIDKELVIHSFQPLEGFCACLLLPVNK